MKTTEPVRDKRQIRLLVDYYLKRGQIRNYVLIVMGLHTALRVSDLLLLRWDDVYDFDSDCVRQNITLTEKKTGKTKSIALHANIIAALRLFADSPDKPAKLGAFLFESPRTKKAIVRSQAYRVIRAAGEAVGIATRVACHSLRKTFGYHAWKDGRSPEILMKIYNHSSLAITARYLGITQDDINAVYLEVKLTA